MFILIIGHKNNKFPAFRMIQMRMATIIRFLLHHSQMTMIAMHDKSLYISIRSVITYDKGCFNLSYRGHLAALQATKLMQHPMGAQIKGKA